MTSFDQLLAANLEGAEIWIGTGYTRVLFAGLEVWAWWFHPWEVDISEYEPDELSEPC